jgi:hypothetical protein
MAGEIRPLDEDIGHLEMENQQAIDDVKRPSDAQKPEFTVYQVRQRLRLRFTGTAGEYFRIWIVNLFLTVLTLGIYSAWTLLRLPNSRLKVPSARRQPDFLTSI